MAKVKKAPARPPAAGPDDLTRRKLETLREDCRRHPRVAVALVQDEDNKTGIPNANRPELSNAREELVQEARAFLDRLGNILEHKPELLAHIGIPAPEPSEWARSRSLAMRVLLWDAPFKTIVASRSAFIGDASDESTNWQGESDPSEVRTRRRKVPDVVAAIAEVCDAILGSREAKASASEFLPPCDNAARLLIELHELMPEDRLKGEEIAKRLRVQPRRARELTRELRDQGWPLELKVGHNGGARLICERLSAEQRDWLERAAP